MARNNRNRSDDERDLRILRLRDAGLAWKDISRVVGMHHVNCRQTAAAILRDYAESERANA